MSINELIDQLKTWDPEAQVSIMIGYPIRNSVTKEWITNHYEAEYFPIRVENIHGHPAILASDEHTED